MGIKIGYDAKRYFNNPTGLGNYSRTLVNYLDQYHAENQYVLFVHKKFNAKGFNRFKVVEGHRQHALWRSYHINNDIEKADIQVFHGLSGELPAGKRKNVKFVVTVHDIIFKLFPRWYNRIDRIVYYEKLRQALDRADKVVAISHQTANDLEKYCDISSDKLSVIYQSWANTYNDIEREEIHVPLLPKEYLLFVGSFYERKNLKSLIWAMSDNKCKDIPLVIVGNGKSRYKQMILELVAQLKLEQQVLILEDVYDELLKQLFIRARAIIYPSLYEGFGLPLLEAWKCNKPAISSNNSSLKEIGTKACILLDNPKDREEMSQAIHDLWYDTELYNRLVAEIPGHLNQFSPETTANQWNDLYHSLL
ncbi:MAG: glycosyltransferase family 4 protein [Bacteroidetes bacterium]|nr:glycosyltransferase family 4 protein [Bacteroidota bacterium]